MLFRNETSLLSDVSLSAIDKKQMTCIMEMQIWPHIHLIIIVFIQFILANIYIVLSFVSLLLFLMSPCFRSFLRIIKENIRLGLYNEEERYLYGITLLKKEMILIFVYMLFAFLYNWFGLVNNDNRITSVNFRRWLFEASFAPVVLCLAFFSYYMECVENLFDKYQLIYIYAIMLKVPLFFLMRYAESQSDFFLNELEASIFYSLCKSSK
jgi:hypothetical protein